MKSTKVEVAGVVFSKLRPSRSDVFADIGCGSGSVSAFFAPYVREVYAVDLKLSEEAKERLKNFENVHVLEMDGLEFLETHEVDLAFFGGTKGIEEMLEVCRARRIVVNAARIEVAVRVSRKMKELGIFDELLMVSVAKGYELAGGTAFRYLNPVFVVCGRRTP
ncbi:MAG: methyltransferase domain-containing protein [Archaeoglobaceae archaeon]